MMLNMRVLVCTLAVLAVLHPISGKRNFGGGRSHSYPKSGGLSGGGHGYPGTSGGGHHTGTGGMNSGGHGYPGSGGMSGGVHGYPGSGGMSGGGHGYPGSGGMSGGGHGTSSSSSHGYPAGKGLSGNTQPAARYPTHTNTNYRYNPPQQISYTPVHGRAPVSYPVYHGTPPTYVYQYKNSGSKYGTLLAGLALLNLGALAGAGTAYAIGHSNSGSSGTTYKPQPGEVCKFAIKKDNGDYEETKIDCQLISSFILQDQLAKQRNSTGNSNSVTTTVTVSNVTVVNTTNSEPPAPAPAPANATIANPVYIMLSNGTLVPYNMTTQNAPNETAPAASSNPMTSSVSVTTTTTNTTVTNALDVKGSPVQVTPGMKCYVIRLSPTSNMRKNIECGLLQTYADKSIRPNSAAHHAPAFTIMAAIVAYILY